MSNHTQLAGKVAIVTGASGAIGAAAAALMLERGASVVAVDLAQASLDKLHADLGAGASLHCVAADVRAEGDVARYVVEARHIFGGVDIFFNNAGVEGAVAPIPDYPMAAFQQVMAVNVTGVFLGLKHVIPVMAAGGGGSIVNTSSIAGLIGSAGLSAYVASKHAVIGLTRTAAIECAPMKIRVNCVNPGPIESRMMHSIETQAEPANPQAAHARFAAMGPSGRYGSCEEVARVVAFLASDESDYVTGCVLPIDGGITAG